MADSEIMERMETVAVEDDITKEKSYASSSCKSSNSEGSKANTADESLQKGVIIRGEQFNPTPTEIDLYGNIQLHHSVSHSNPDINNVKQILLQFPKGAEKKNQFGRLPLHYVVDRPNTSLPVAELLLKSYPQGACVEDDEGNTPYDLALHWKHPKKMLRLLLKPNKLQDLDMWRRLEYGFLYEILYCCCCWHRDRQTIGNGASESADDGEHHNIIRLPAVKA